MPIFETCLDCGHTYKISPSLQNALQEKGVSLDDEQFYEPCLRCSNTPQDKRKMYRFWLGHDRADVTSML